MRSGSSLSMRNIAIANGETSSRKRASSETLEDEPLRTKRTCANWNLEHKEYIKDIDRFWRSRQIIDTLVLYTWDAQPDVSGKMREILLDWLVGTHGLFKLSQATLFLAIRLLDTYAGRKKIARKDLQLVGITCLMIASKYEETNSPSANEFIFMTNGAYSDTDILSMERSVLETLDFRISVPTIYSFLALYTGKLGLTKSRIHFANYLAELSLQCVEVQCWLPGKVASACLFLACKSFNDGGNLDFDVASLTGFKQHEIKDVSLSIASRLENITVTKTNRRLVATRSKYGIPEDY